MASRRKCWESWGNLWYSSWPWPDPELEFLRCVKNIGNQSAAASPDRRNPLGSLQLWNIPRRWYSRDIPMEATLSAFNWYRFVSTRVNAVVSGKKQICYKKNPLAVFNWTLENILMFSCIEQSAQNIPVDGKGDTLVSISVKCCWHWSLNEKTFCEFHGIQFLKSSTLRFHLRNVRDEVK